MVVQGFQLSENGMGFTVHCTSAWNIHIGHNWLTFSKMQSMDKLDISHYVTFKTNCKTKQKTPPQPTVAWRGVKEAFKTKELIKKMVDVWG